jgi:uncharacterized LabA/DUF88 family protein
VAGSVKNDTVYAFIDSQNLNLGIKSLGWKLDYKKFRLYLKNKYKVEKAYLFIGQVEGNESLYEGLESAGYDVVFKPTTEYEVDGEKTVKGNVDAELVLYAAAKVYKQFNKAIIVSSDGDFLCLAQYLSQRQKLLSIMVPNGRYSQLLGEFQSSIVRLDKLKRSLQYSVKNTKKDQRRRSVETLGVSGHGDNKSIPKTKVVVNKKRAGRFHKNEKQINKK